MQSYTQAQVAKKYNVSRATVNRWVDLAISGKYNLQLDHSAKAVRILDNAHNEVELAMLSEAAIKYKSGNLKQVQVSDEFYQIFDEDSVLEIFNDLLYRNQVNSKFTYINGGAMYWDAFYNNGTIISKSIDSLLDNSLEDIYYYSSLNPKINVIDLGPGNGYPVKKLITSIVKKRLLHSYTALDISKEIIEITKANIRSWFPKLKINSYIKDLEYGKIGNIFFENKQKGETNLVLHLGNTLCNYEDRIQVLKNIAFGMAPNDLLILSFTLDQENNKTSLNYVKNEEADNQDFWLTKAVGIDLDQCEIKLEYNPILNCKTKYMILDKDYEIEYRLGKRQEILNLQKGQIITTWRHYLIDIQTFIDEIRAVGMELLELKTDQDGANALAICRVKV
jgi:uncharacterized SAM-dependent methyltransferase